MESVRQNILVVDDDPSILSLCRQWLASQGFDVTVARDVYEARNILGQNQFDLLITDFEMPGLNGYDLVRDLRNKGNQVPVIVMSGMPSASNIFMNAEITDWAFLDKPFRTSDFQKVVRRIIPPKSDDPAPQAEAGI